MFCSRRVFMRYWPFLFLLVFFPGCVSTAPNTNPILQSPTPRVCFSDSSCIEVEIASTPEERTRGLMFRDHLDAEAGMIFVFDESSVHSFWMKNTLVPLDVIWLDSELRIVDIQTAVPCAQDPCAVYTPQGDSQYVLEINAGKAAEWGLEIGQSVSFRQM